MKSEILRILQMQADGKLSQDQAAELLAILADQAREKVSSASTNQGTDSAGASGPEARACGGGEDGKECGSWNATSVLHDFVDTAVGIGATVGRVATVWGSEMAHMVHREELGNTITMSKVEEPSGVEFVIRDNTFNVSKVSQVSLNHAELTHNSVNASHVAHLSVTGGQFSQCQISGSSISHVTIEGAVGVDNAPPAGERGGIRGVTFNATKFSRVRVLAGSRMDGSKFQASAIKDLVLDGASELRDSRINDVALTGVRLAAAKLKGVTIERANVQALTLKDVTLDAVTIAGTRVSETTVAGGTWTNTRFRRDPQGGGVGGKDNVLQESKFENCTLTDCEFSGCTFRRTTVRNVTVTGLKVRNVDFTGMVIESEEAFRKAAGL